MANTYTMCVCVCVMCMRVYVCVPFVPILNRRSADQATVRRVGVRRYDCVPKELTGV